MFEAYRLVTLDSFLGLITYQEKVWWADISHEIRADISPGFEPRSCSTLIERRHRPERPHFTLESRELNIIDLNKPPEFMITKRVQSNITKTCTLLSQVTVSHGSLLLLFSAIGRRCIRVLMYLIAWN